MQFFHLFELHPAVLFAQAGILVSMLVGSMIRFYALRSASPEVAQKRLASLKTWWVIAILFCLAMLVVPLGGILFFTLVSLLAMKEFLTLTRVPYAEWRLQTLVYFLVLLNYLWIYFDWQAMFVVFLPLCGLVLVATWMVLRDRADDFLLAAGSLYWAMMLAVYFISHAPLLLTLPADTNLIAGTAGWFLYLLLLTAISDISQALVGRRFGRHYIAPVLSPHKTWEGLVGGIVTTVVVAALLAPALTPLAETSLLIGTFEISVPYLPAVLAGLVISIGGYFGDLTISGVKRDIGVKDSGTMLPGQGGILDRIDSLMFAAPLFYYFLRATSAVCR